MTPDEDINLEEDGDTSFENLKNDLKKASEDLNNLADYCEQNFKGPEVVPDRPLTLENAKLYGAFGSEELIETGDFAVQALNAIAFNVCCLAENMEAKMENLGRTIKNLSHDISMMSMDVKIFERKVSDKKMGEAFKAPKSYDAKAPTPQGKKYWKFQPRTYKLTEHYDRKPINYEELDGIGSGGQFFAAAEKPSCEQKQIVDIPEQEDPKEENLVPKVPAIFYQSSEEKFATGPRRRSKMSTKIRRTQMPKIPTREAAHDLRRQKSEANHDVMRLSMLPPMPDLDAAAELDEEEAKNGETLKMEQEEDDDDSDGLDALFQTLNELKASLEDAM